MNKKYIVNEDGVVIVTTDKNEIIERSDKYNRNTAEILVLENVIESLNKKISWFNDGINDSESKINHNVLFMIGQIIVSILFWLILNLFMTNLVTITGLLIYGLIEITLISIVTTKIIKYRDKIEKYEKKIKHVNSIIKKVTKRIDSLSKDNREIKIDKVNEYQDVVNIYEYNFDPSDYFIQRYNIDKRTQEYNNSKKKVRKLSKNNNQLLNYKR